jgi:hypothetical protein
MNTPAKTEGLRLIEKVGNVMDNSMSEYEGQCRSCQGLGHCPVCEGEGPCDFCNSKCPTCDGECFEGVGHLSMLIEQRLLLKAIWSLEAALPELRKGEQLSFEGYAETRQMVEARILKSRRDFLRLAQVAREWRKKEMEMGWRND